jgi:hypothetical protein
MKKAGTTAQQIEVHAVRRKPTRTVQYFRKLQATYTPGTLQALARREVPDDEKIKNLPLMLPSALSAAEREVGCAAGVAEMEQLMRSAQCREALALLRLQLTVKARLVAYKRGNARAQGANMRSQGIMKRNESKILLHSEKYQTAWKAILQFVGGGEAKVGWRRLRKGDIHMLEDGEELTAKADPRKKHEERRRAQEQ